MKMKTPTCILKLVTFALLLSAIESRSLLRRVKRQNRPQTVDPSSSSFDALAGLGNYYAPSRLGDYRAPFFNPLPGRSSSVNSPTFPFVSNYNMGLRVAPFNQQNIDGYLNLPLPGWGMWDLKGALRTGTSPIDVGVGFLQSPTNPLGLERDTFETLTNSQQIGQAALNAPALPVANLPGNFQPLICRPPICNPFISNTAFGVAVEPGDDTFIDGGLDFPVPLGDNGLGIRFPLSGGFGTGAQPLVINYGQNIGPVVPDFPTTPAPATTAINPFAGFPLGGFTTVPPAATADPNPFAGFESFGNLGTPAPVVPTAPPSPFLRYLRRFSAKRRL